MEKLVNEYEIDCGFSKKYGYLFSQNKEQTEQLQDAFEASKKAGCEVEYADSIPLPIDFQKALVFKNHAQFHPSKYIYALAKAFENAGGIIVPHCRVTAVKENEEKILEVETNTIEKILAKNLIYATHIPPGVNLLHFRWEQCFLNLENYLRRYFDIEEIAFKWSSQYFESADGLPYIGHLPGNPDTVFVATGNGITYSQVAAKILTDLITNHKSEFDNLFNPSRIKPVAGFTNFVKNAADVTSHFIEKLFPAAKINGLAGLANGEAKVVKYEDHSIALYKDEKGTVHSVNPSCTHINCMIEWNTAEKVWKCPCHGSRFSEEGEMYTGPARKDLGKIKLS